MRGVIFDVDGTLVATNDAHIEAWRRAFAAFGYEVPVSRIRPEVGKGGDMLVPSVIGEANDAQDGDRIRDRHAAEFLGIARESRFAVLPGAVEILEHLRERRTPAALATSSKLDHLEATLRSAGIDFRKLVEHVVTGSDAEASKPAPDIVIAAVGKLGLPPGNCVFVGDTPHDATASLRAGVAFVGVTAGGNTRDTLLEAGARGVWSNLHDLLAHLDEALDLTAAPRAG